MFDHLNVRKAFAYDLVVLFIKYRRRVQGDCIRRFSLFLNTNKKRLTWDVMPFPPVTAAVAPMTTDFPLCLFQRWNRRGQQPQRIRAKALQLQLF